MLCKMIITNGLIWYNAYDEDESGQRVYLQEKSFNGWYSRKSQLILLRLMLRAIAQSDLLVLQWKHVEEFIEGIKAR